MSSVTFKVITANDLLEGDVVYFTIHHGWTRNLDDAVLFDTSTEADTALVAAYKQHDVVIGPYVIDAQVDQSHQVVPTHFRERFRNEGPSTRRDLNRRLV